jgi:hypothetical protein
VELEGLEAYELNKTGEEWKLEYNIKRKYVENSLYVNGKIERVENCYALCSGSQLEPTKFPNEWKGSTCYYNWRENDFKLRKCLEGKSEAQPPGYYCDYGDKYINVFTYKINDRLSESGKVWNAEARKNLQEGMELILENYPVIEDDPMKLSQMAFDSHVNAYEHAGLFELDFADKSVIFLAPELKDLLRQESIDQIETIIKHQIEFYIANPEVLIKHSTKYLLWQHYEVDFNFYRNIYDGATK